MQWAQHALVFSLRKRCGVLKDRLAKHHQKLSSVFPILVVVSQKNFANKCNKLRKSSSEGFSYW